MKRTVSMPVGVIVRRKPGVTRWAKWVWNAVAVLPGAGPGGWRELQRDGAAVDYHAATLDLTLHRAETDAYLTTLNGAFPAVYVIMRGNPGAAGADGRPVIVGLTVSAFTAQDHADNGEDMVEPVAMPPGIVAWIADFVQCHHRDQVFIKRQRQPFSGDQVEDGIGDARIRQVADVFRAPGDRKGPRR